MVSLAEQDVFAWFRQLPSYRRIEALCQMFTMCVPLELRFVETYLAKIAQREALYLKDHENRANSLAEVTKLANADLGLLDGPTRSRLVISLALLKSESSETSKLIYRMLATGLKDRSSLPSLDTKCLEELVLLFSMAALHPAFTYSEQTSLESVKSEITSYVPEEPPKSGVPMGTQTVNTGVQNQFYYPVPMLGSVMPPFQWCPPQGIIPVPQGMPTHSKLCQVSLSVTTTPSKFSVCGSFSDGRQVHVTKDVTQIAALRGKLHGTNTPFPVQHSSLQSEVPKEVRDFFDDVCANYADAEPVHQFFDPHPMNGLRFVAPPPLTSQYRENEVRNVLRTANIKKYIPKFNDVVTMTDFCELSQESLKARGLSNAAISRVQKIQAQNGAQNGHASGTGNWQSSEDDSPPSSSPSPPTASQFTQPYYGIMVPTLMQQGGTTFSVPTNYTGYHIPYVAGHQPTGAYVTTQGVQASSQQMAPLLVQHNGVAHHGSLASHQTQQVHSHNGPTTIAHHHHHHHNHHNMTHGGGAQNGAGGAHQSREGTPGGTKSERAASCKSTATTNHSKFHSTRGGSPLVSVGSTVPATGENGHN